MGGAGAAVLAGAIAYAAFRPAPQPPEALAVSPQALPTPNPPPMTRPVTALPPRIVPPPAAKLPQAAPPAAPQATVPAQVTPAVARPPAPAETGPRFDVVRVTPEGEAVIAGRATPGATVVVFDGNRPIGEATADKRGEWVLLPNGPLPPGSRELSLVERTPQADPVPSGNVVVLVVPENKRDAAGRPAEPTGALAVAIPRDGGASTVLQAPPPAQTSEVVMEPDAAPVKTATIPSPGSSPGPAPVPAPGGSSTRGIPPVPAGGVTVETMDYDTAGKVAMGGRAQPGNAVQLYLDNNLVGSVPADTDGRWRLSPERPVDPGVYTLRADQVAPSGKVVARVELPVQVSEVPKDLPEGRSVVVQPGNSLWRIARRTYGDGVQYTVIYQANRGQIRDPDMIYPGQIFALPTTN